MFGLILVWFGWFCLLFAFSLSQLDHPHYSTLPSLASNQLLFSKPPRTSVLWNPGVTFSSAYYLSLLNRSYYALLLEKGPSLKFFCLRLSWFFILRLWKFPLIPLCWSLLHLKSKYWSVCSIGPNPYSLLYLQRESNLRKNNNLPRW